MPVEIDIALLCRLHHEHVKKNKSLIVKIFSKLSKVSSELWKFPFCNVSLDKAQVNQISS